MTFSTLVGAVFVSLSLTFSVCEFVRGSYSLFVRYRLD